MRWSLREAKQKFGALVRQAQDSPQIITEDGEAKAVLVSIKHYRTLERAHEPDTSESSETLVALLRTSPHRDVDLTPER
ncbi:MAG: type II toxin-antitoxin system Phd/YefM family antitoxin [Trueperaceae bacterium]|nr:type II toxin-antitoxin system Phd/YefM family antitoxin [Trueperaceae bacterium]